MNIMMVRLRSVTLSVLKAFHALTFIVVLLDYSDNSVRKSGFNFDFRATFDGIMSKRVRPDLKNHYQSENLC